MLPLWTFFIHKKQFTILLMVALIGAGLAALFYIPKESAPEVKLPMAIVTTVLPGASAADVERLVTDKLEEKLNSLSHLDKLTSRSQEGVSTVVTQFTSDANLDKAIQDVKDGVEKAKPNLPSEVKTPIVTQIDFADQPVLILSVSGDYLPTELTKLGDVLKDDLQSVKGVSRVDVSGVSARQVQVVVNKEKLDQYKLRLVDVVGALQAANASLPVGSITMDNIEYAIKFKGDITDPAEVGNIVISSGSGAPVYLRDIAFISDGVAKPATYSRASVSGAPSTPSLTLSVHKTTGGNVVTVVDAVKSRLEELKKTTLKGDQVVISIDNGKKVQKDLSELSRVGFETMVLVMLSLFLTIGWRESLVAGASIPLSFLIAFIGLEVSGNSLNFVSLFALILAIGILVDSGIVVTEAIHARMKKYATKEEAALASLREYAWPLIAGTMTTIAVFIPLFFISGIVGEFIKSIPFTLIFVLFASIFVALGLVPLIAILFTSTELNALEKRQEEYTHAVQAWYQRFLGRILGNRQFENRFLVGMIAAFVLAMMLPGMGIIKSVFFPQDDLDFVYVEIEKPQGTALGETDLATRSVEEVLYGNPNISSFVTTVGESSSLSQDPSSGSKYANITIMLADHRTKTSTQMVEELRHAFADMHGAEVRVYEPSNGPPSGSPVVIKFMGDNMEDLSLAVSRSEDLLKGVKGATEVTTSTKNNGTQIALTVDKAKAAAVGLNPAIIAQTLRSAINGVTATTIKQQSQDIDIEVKLNLNTAYTNVNDTAVATPDAIRELTIQTPTGPVLLGSILRVEAQQGNAVISHESRKRVETVSSNVAKSVTAGEVTAAFRARIGELHLPEGVEMKIGGETEDVNRSFTEMFFAFIGGIVLMLAILVLEFNSFRNTLYLLSIIPLSLIGVFAGLLFMNQPLSFSSLLGVIALAGVIINHAIILMDSMHRIEKAKGGMSHKDVVIEAASSRIRPIFLTTITTVIGMIPLAGASSMWGPLAYAIMFGLAFSMLLTLVLIPILYYRWPGKGVR